MFITRLISGIVVLFLAVVTMIIGGNVFFIFVGLLSLIGIYELYKTDNIHLNPIGLIGYLGTFFYLIAVYIGMNQGPLLAIIVTLLALMSLYVFTFPTYHVDQIMYGLFGVVYVTVLMTCLYQIREMTDGLYLIPLVFVCAWGNDTCAYCVGMLIGKHKMAPKLSPKKSVEGFFGGIIGAALLGYLYGAVLGGHLSTLSNPALYCSVMCGLGALIAVVGDLAASAIKRDKGIKDYGRLIPGHGGVLDRFDSILFTAPVVYFLAMYLTAFTA